MIVMREIQLRLAAEAWLERASRRLAESSHVRLSNPWLNCCLQAHTLSDQCLTNSTLVLKRASVTDSIPLPDQSVYRTCAFLAKSRYVSASRKSSVNTSRLPGTNRDKSADSLPVTQVPDFDLSDAIEEVSAYWRNGILRQTFPSAHGTVRMRTLLDYQRRI